MTEMLDVDGRAHRVLATISLIEQARNEFARPTVRSIHQLLDGELSIEQVEMAVNRCVRLAWVAENRMSVITWHAVTAAGRAELMRD